MSLSRPAYWLMGAYLEQLFNHPVQTKSVTSSALAATANYTAQRLSGQKKINNQSVIAYALFGLTFGGSVPHYFYQTLERLFSKDVKFRRFWQLLSERLIFAPFYQLLSLYFLAIFEMKTHDEAVANVMKLYWPLLKANWQYLTPLVFLNMTFVPPMLRTPAMSLVSFIWVVYIAMKRRRLQEKQSGKGTTKSS